MIDNNNRKAFLALVRAGLWETNARLSQFNDIDFSQVLTLAEEQSIVGLVAAGMEHAEDVKIPKEIVLQFVGQTLQLEQLNKAMNRFIAKLVEKMRQADIYTLLLKGQGVAQCYERSLWRTCGDVDMFLSDENYAKAKKFLMPLATNVEPEGVYSKHLGMTIGQWVVELHGSMRSGLSRRVDKGLDAIRDSVFHGGNVRSWDNKGTLVFLPSAENDAIYIFTHFLQHFYKGGIGLRQICDWCRILWVYRDTINREEVKKHLRAMGLMSEWKAFGAFAVDILGMPVEAMPFYDDSNRWKRKALLIQEFVLMSGNMGHNRDNSYSRYPYLIRKAFSFGRRIGDLANHARIFPLDSFRFLPTIVFNGVRSAIRGE